jgi:hypothetical protein
MRLDHLSGLSIELPVVDDRAIREEVIGIGWKTDPDATSEFARDSPLEEAGFEPVWGFSCQALFWVVLTVFCSERERPFFVPSPAIRFAERAEGVKGPKR